MLHILFVQCHWTKYPSPSLTAWLQQYEVLRSYYFFFTSSSNSSYWIQRPQKREVKNPRFFPVNYLLPFFFFHLFILSSGRNSYSIPKVRRNLQREPLLTIKSDFLYNMGHGTSSDQLAFEIDIFSLI